MDREPQFFNQKKLLLHFSIGPNISSNVLPGVKKSIFLLFIFYSYSFFSTFWYIESVPLKCVHFSGVLSSVDVSKSNSIRLYVSSFLNYVQARSGWSHSTSLRTFFISTSKDYALISGKSCLLSSSRGGSVSSHYKFKFVGGS